MKVTVLGASGKTGGHLVRGALARGWEVTALVRPGTSWEAPAGVRVVRGELPGAAAEACASAELVFVALGLRREGPSPRAKLLSPPDLMSTTVGELLRVVPKGTRVVYLSAHGVGDSRPSLGWLRRLQMRGTKVRVAWLDHAKAEAALAAAGAAWTSVRPGPLDDAAPAAAARVLPAGAPPGGPLRRSEVARFMLDCAESGAHRGAAVCVGS